MPVRMKTRKKTHEANERGRERVEETARQCRSRFLSTDRPRCANEAITASRGLADRGAVLLVLTPSVTNVTAGLAFTTDLEATSIWLSISAWRPHPPS